MSDVIDLNALMPQPVVIRLGDQEIPIQPPKTSVLLRLGAIGNKMQSLEALSGEEVDQLEKELKAVIAECVPELSDKELSSAQIMKLAQIIGEMGIPPEADELKKRGITVDDSKKVQ